MPYYSLQVLGVGATHHGAHCFAEALHDRLVRLRLAGQRGEAGGRGVPHEGAFVLEGGPAVPQGHRCAPIARVEVAQHTLEAKARRVVQAGGAVLLLSRGQCEAGDWVLRVRLLAPRLPDPQVLSLAPRPRVDVDRDGGEPVGGEVGGGRRRRQHRSRHARVLELAGCVVILPRRPAHPQPQVLACEQGACKRERVSGMSGCARESGRATATQTDCGAQETHRRSSRPPRARSRRAWPVTPPPWTR